MRRKIIIAIVFVLVALQVYIVAGAESKENSLSRKQQETTTEQKERQKKHEPKKMISMNTNELLGDLRLQYGEGGEQAIPYSSLEKKYDGRGYVTPVKDQGYTQWCWCYSLISCAETSMIKNGLMIDGQKATVKNTDLSEAALVYYMYKREVVKDPLNGSNGDKNNYLLGATHLFDYSGNALMAGMTLSTWMGVKPESYYSVDTYDYSSIGKIDTSKAYTKNTAVVKNINYVMSDQNSVKQAVKTYGSVVACINWDSYYFDYDTAAFCNPYCDGTTNHSVTIVGWDDTYSKDKFFGYAKSNGAWIVKNSWSEEWGDKGYFYISYEDATLFPMCTVEMQKADTYAHNYFYDGTSGIDTSIMKNGGKIANEFIAHGNSSGREVLNAISFVTGDSNINYKIQIYKDLTKNSDPLSGTKALSTEQKGTAIYPGVHTVKLEKNVYLDEGEHFAIVITLSSKEYEYVIYGTEETDDYGWIAFHASCSKNQSFYKDKESNGWKDLSKNNACARIKAYTNNTTYKKVTFKDGGKIVKEQYIAKGKNATAPTLTKAGYTLSWDKAYTKVEKDLIVTAVWKANSYTIKYQANGGKNTMSDQRCSYGKKYTLRANQFTKSGYCFIGWSTKKDGSGGWYKERATIKNLTKTNNGIVTLYAQWAKKTTISYLKSTKTGKFTIKYTKTNASQTGYQITYSTSKKFTSSTTKTVTVKGYKNISKTISSLKKGKTYYVKVRTYKTVNKVNYYGGYSAYKAVKIKK